jgi:hypothetical protein
MTAIRMDIADASLRSQVADAAAEAGARIVSVAADLQVVDVGALTGGSVSDGSGGPLLVVCTGLDDPGLAVAREQCAHVVALPSGRPWLVRLLRPVDSGPVSAAHVIAVVGARGGAGATTVTAGLAAAADGPVVVVDADPSGPGIDAVAGLEDSAGIRWTDLVGVRGGLPDTALRGRLPRTGSVDWLATPAGTPNAASWPAVMASLAAVFPLMVVDLPRFRLVATPPPEGAACVVVSPLELASLGNARALAESGLLGADPLIALRPVGGPVRMATAEQLLTGYRLVELPDSRALRGAADFGDLPAAVARGSFARACRALLQELPG